MIQISDLIGLPYNNRTFNCWHLVCEVYKRLELSLPDFTPTDDNFNRAFLRSLSGDTGFERIDKPEQYCVMILRNPHYIHCGIYLDGKVLHNEGHVDKGQVLISYMSDIRDSFKTIEYYKWRE